MAIAEHRFLVRGKGRPRKPPASAGKHGSNATRRWSKALTVTISGGLAQQGDRHGTPQAVIKAADEVLYRAKHAGRNCLVVAKG